MVFWVFGYGSLVWNPGLDYDEKIIGFIKDYRRVFDLACINYRGTPESPARTCTLESVEEAICWGAAFCVHGGPERERLAMEYLERRECKYDVKTLVDFYKGDPQSQDPVVYDNGVTYMYILHNNVYLMTASRQNCNAASSLLLLDNNDQIICSDVVGALKMRAYLSGMPECKLGLNDRVLLEAQGRATKEKLLIWMISSFITISL